MQQSQAAQQGAMQQQTLAQDIRQAGSAAQQAGPQFQQLGQQAQGAGSGATGALGGLSNAIGQTGSAATGAAGGMSGLLKTLIGIGGGFAGSMGSPFGGLISGLAGMFREGGMSDSPVESGSMTLNAWGNAPHYAEGTPNTSGGIPAILHDNEAVIPLSRGRSIPVEMRGGKSGDSEGASAGPNITINMHGIKDFDTFRRSKSQLEADMAAAVARAARA
jgi:hypothetical protein